MAHIAEVIVDVPVMQTNIPYSYHIPEKYINQLQPGMRVIVPFGKGNRQVQGFVVLISEQDDTNDELKSISSVMDLHPVLNEELLQLGTYMSNETFSFRINCFQTMLPAVYRAKYSKRIVLKDTSDEEIIYELFNGKNYIDWEDAEDRGILPELLRLRKEQVVDIDYLVTDTRTKKYHKYIMPIHLKDEYQSIIDSVPGNATRQLAFLELLKEADGPLFWNDIRDNHHISSNVLNTAVKRQWCKVKEVEVYRDPFEDENFTRDEPLELTDEQQYAFNQVNQKVINHEHEVFLLEGITGSGKTEVYLQLIQEVLNQGEGAIVLVPEISLTPQMVIRFKSRFGDDVAVLHSGLSDSEKYDEWRKIEKEEAHVVVGARSSIFAPLKNIGMIIIDEEHESTYKQEETPRYHARDIAIWRAEYHDCPVVLGSATPSLESRARTLKDVYTLLELKTRANNKPLPPIQVVDMRDEVKKNNRSSFSLQLQSKIREKITKGEQVVLLLNRRGFSSFVMCRDCGYVLECPNCDISLTLHMDTKSMKCHYCGHEEAIPRVCNECGSRSIRYYGTGTQKIEEELKAMIPESKIIRMDVDTTRRKGAHKRLLDKFEQKEGNILLGTQMIAKGLDFPNVTLVGVINADTALGLPDFRSAENTFQLLTQVSGRAGRGDLSGEVIIQSFNPEHYAIQLAKHHDYETFFKKEMLMRKASQYSPFYYLIRISVSHQDEIIASKKMGEIVELIKPVLSNQAIILGPTPKSIARTHNRYHYQTIIKYKFEDALKDRLRELMKSTQKDTTNGLYISIDPKPMNFI